MSHIKSNIETEQVSPRIEEIFSYPKECNSSASGSSASGSSASGSSPSPSHIMTGKYAAFMETNDKECECWYYFIRYEGNEKNVRALAGTDRIN